MKYGGLRPRESFTRDRSCVENDPIRKRTVAFTARLISQWDWPIPTMDTSSSDWGITSALVISDDINFDINPESNRALACRKSIDDVKSDCLEKNGTGLGLTCWNVKASPGAEVDGADIDSWDSTSRGRTFTRLEWIVEKRLVPIATGMAEEFRGATFGLDGLDFGFWFEYSSSIACPEKSDPFSG